MQVDAFIPEDRRAALAAGLSLPARTCGAALFADISGFTPLTEALAHRLGPKRGAEVLTQQLNLVYSALISAVEAWQGSVIGFSGDAPVGLMTATAADRQAWRPPTVPLPCNRP